MQATLINYLNQLDKEHAYYQNMRQVMVMRNKELKCSFDKVGEAFGSIRLNLMVSHMLSVIHYKLSLMSAA